MLEFEHIGVRSAGKQILRDVSFQLRSHRITVLLGRNGSGKSTLIRSVNQLQSYTGFIRLGGADLRTIPPRERARRIAILPQILPETSCSVRALAELGRTPHTSLSGHLSAEDHQAVQEALQLSGMETFADRPCSQLSGGERQRAFLAMLLAQQAQLLLMDEPTTYMDVDARRQLHLQLRELVRRRRNSLMIVMHDLNEAMELADDVVILDAGSCIFSGSRQECLDQCQLERAFQVERHEICKDGRKLLFFR